MVKTIQQIKRVILNYLKKPKKTDAECCDANGDPDPDIFEMAVFAWKKLQVNKILNGQVQG